jgi:hypothetical protein
MPHTESCRRQLPHPTKLRGALDPRWFLAEIACTSSTLGTPKGEESQGWDIFRDVASPPVRLCRQPALPPQPSILLGGEHIRSVNHPETSGEQDQRG